MPHNKIDPSTRYTGKQDLPLARRIEDPTKFDRAKPEQVSPITLEKHPYFPSDALKEAVNLAIALGRPLLLQGEPGCGKTRLAEAVAYELGLPLETAYIKSTSRAQDLLYSYDAINRLYDAQMHEAKAKSIGNYIKLGPLGRAIARAQAGRRSVVLIDEIDKADLDYPNDLLYELDQLAFKVEEAPDIHYKVPENQPKLRPIVIITHNEEKTLPSAFLRRCIFHYVEFPETHLAAILNLHYDDLPKTFTAEAIRVLKDLRNNPSLRKKPGLSELIDWVGYTRAVNTPEAELENLPYLGVLLKSHPDQQQAKSQEK